MKGILLMLASMMSFACMDTASKILTTSYAVPQILLLRYVLFLMLGLLLARPFGLRTALRSARPGLQLARSVIIVVEAGVFVLAFRYLPLADTHAIAAASPLIVVALSVPMLGERVGPHRWAAVAAGFAGVLVIVRPGFAELRPVLLIPMLGAFLFALYQVMIRYLSGIDRSETTVLWNGIVGVAMCAIAAPFVWRTPDARAWLLLLLIAALGVAAHWLLIKALEASPASVLQPFGYMLLVWASLMGFLVFGHVPDVWTIAGAAIVVASGLYAIHRDRIAAARARDPAPPLR